MPQTNSANPNTSKWVVFACAALIVVGMAGQFAPAISSSLPQSWEDLGSLFSMQSKAPAAWVLIVRDESKQTHAQTKAWESIEVRKVLAANKVQFRLLDPSTRDAMPKPFWPFLEKAATIKSEEGVVLMLDAESHYLAAQKAPQTEAEFLSLLKKKGHLP